VTDNPFVRLAEAQMSRATKAKNKRAEVKQVMRDADAPMKPGELEQKLADQSKQVSSYNTWKRSELAKMQAQYGENWDRFALMVRKFTFDSNPLDFICFLNELQWLHQADLRARQIALSYIANRLVKLRLEAGLAPFDDSLPGEEPTLFEIIRQQLRVIT
jgi:hypothetical protein